MMSLFCSALSSYQTQGTGWFIILAGALLGVSAALLWSAQGSIMMSYPLEKDKGKAFAIFWAIFQFGSFIGSLIALAINIRSGGLSAVSTSTYIVSPPAFRAPRLFPPILPAREDETACGAAKANRTWLHRRRSWSSSSSVSPRPS